MSIHYVHILMLLLLSTKYNLFSLSIVVGFNPTVYTVIEGQDTFARLIIFRTGNTNLTGAVTFTTESGTAEGTHYKSIDTVSNGIKLEKLYMLLLLLYTFFLFI